MFDLLNLFIDEVLRQIRVFSLSDFVFFVLMLGTFNRLFNFIRFEAWRKL